MLGSVSTQLRSALVAAAIATSCLSTTDARATIVERVVAVVGERAILLSQLTNRGRPYVAQIAARFPKGAQRSAQISQMYKALVEKMVDEELMRRAANKARISVTAREIESSIARVAHQARVAPERLVQEAIRSGLTEREYRQEMRRQVLEAKLLNLRVSGRIRVTPDDVKSAYRRIVLDERAHLEFRAAWIRIVARRGEAGRPKRALAERVAKAAAAGADFAELARRYSEDPRTRDSGGLLGRLRPGALPKQVDRMAMTLEVGGVSRPVRVGDALVIVKVLEREESSLPSLEEARAELQQRVYVEKMNRARQHWLDGLRRQTHVDVRL